MRVPLVHGQGNFGSVDGDPPAAERYTEAKLTAVSERLMSELRQRTVPMRPNYENTREEPVVLPAQFPNLLVNGAVRHRRRHGDEHPAAQPRRSGAGGGPADRQPRSDDRPAAGQDQGAGLPARRHGSSPTAPRCARSTRRAPAASRCRANGRWRRSGKKQQIVVTSIPYGVDKGKLESDIGDIIDDAQAAAAAQPHQRDRTRRKASASSWR